MFLVCFKVFGQFLCAGVWVLIGFAVYSDCFLSYPRVFGMFGVWWPSGDQMAPGCSF